MTMLEVFMKIAGKKILLISMLLGIVLFSGCVKATVVPESEAIVEEVTQYSTHEYPLERNGIMLHLDCVTEDGTEPENNILLIHGVTYSSHEFDID